jgi:glycosyltransferase involved in cell wall biosynthesis
MEKIRVIFISSVRPEPTSAGQIILHRHFCNRPEFDLEVYGFEPTKFSVRMLLRRVLGRLARLSGIFEMLVNCAWVLCKGRWIDEDLPTKVERDQKTIVGTVAHGDGFYAAQRFAKKHSLPLVVFFQDWWPDMAGVPKPFVRLLDKQFLALAKSCSLGICVCDGMKSALGGGGNLEVLPPIPAETDPPTSPVSNTPPSGKFKILYFGNLDLYGGMILQALRIFKNHSTIQLQVRGSNPNWPENAKKEMRDAGLWLEFAPRLELDSWLQSADAFLVPMVFEEKYRRRMETSFPSKLIEFAQFGKPLIVWGPEYCSALRWARWAKMPSPVADPAPEALVNSIQKFSEAYPRLIGNSFYTLGNEFNPLKIQMQFLGLLKSLLKRK